jgi:2-polyprenyl-3-methyl-5-hydroxy-6-metoxy-1,4-benzoquinol methylase
MPISKLGTKKNIYLECKDHSVTGEYFKLYYDEYYDMLVTSPQPGEDSIGNYYESKDYISHTDANISFVEKWYQRVKRITLKHKLRIVNSFGKKNTRLLDVGCGTGDFLKICAMAGWEVRGVEPNDNARKIAQQKLSENSNASVESTLPESELTFDIITLWHALEHVSDLELYLKFLQKYLSPNGRLLIAVPNYKSFDARHYKSFWAAFDVPRHFWHFSKSSISKLFSEKGLSIEKTKPMLFDSFYVSLLSEKIKTGKSNFIKAMWIGLLSNLLAIKTKEYSSLLYILKHS